MLKVIKIELLKLKRYYALILFMLIPIFFICLGIINFARNKELFTSSGEGPWNNIFTQSAIFYGTILLPILTTIIMAMIARIDNQGGNWKRMVSMPVNRKCLYLGKFIVGCLLVLINILIFIMVTAISGIFIQNTLQVPLFVIIRPLAAFIALLPIMAIQYYLSVKFSNLGIPLGIGIGCSIPSLLISNTKLWIIFPWTYPGRAILVGTNVSFENTSSIMYVIGILFLIFVGIIGIKEFNMKDIR